MERLFTRADVEQHVMQCLGKDKNPVYTVDQVCLLTEMPVPAWIVYCTATWQPGMDYEYSRPCVSIVFQKLIIGEPCLYFAIQADLPAGLANADEEDTAVAQREAKRRAELLRKQGQDDASA